MFNRETFRSGDAERPDAKVVETEVNKVLDDALEQLRWCRQHAEERRASEVLRQLETKLGYLAQALSWEMDGESRKAESALALALGHTRRQRIFYDPHAYDDLNWGH